MVIDASEQTPGPDQHAWLVVGTNSTATVSRRRRHPSSASGGEPIYDVFCCSTRCANTSEPAIQYPDRSPDVPTVGPGVALPAGCHFIGEPGSAAARTMPERDIQSEELALRAYFRRSGAGSRLCWRLSSLRWAGPTSRHPARTSDTWRAARCAFRSPVPSTRCPTRQRLLPASTWQTALTLIMSQTTPRARRCRPTVAGLRKRRCRTAARRAPRTATTAIKPSRTAGTLPLDPRDPSADGVTVG